MQTQHINQKQLTNVKDSLLALWSDITESTITLHACLDDEVSITNTKWVFDTRDFYSDSNIKKAYALFNLLFGHQLKFAFGKNEVNTLMTIYELAYMTIKFYEHSRSHTITNPSEAQKNLFPLEKRGLYLDPYLPFEVYADMVKHITSVDPLKPAEAVLNVYKALESQLLLDEEEDEPFIKIFPKVPKPLKNWSDNNSYYNFKAPQVIAYLKDKGNPVKEVYRFSKIKHLDNIEKRNPSHDVYAYMDQADLKSLIDWKAKGFFKFNPKDVHRSARQSNDLNLLYKSFSHREVFEWVLLNTTSDWKHRYLRVAFENLYRLTRDSKHAERKQYYKDLCEQLIDHFVEKKDKRGCGIALLVASKFGMHEWVKKLLPHALMLVTKPKDKTHLNYDEVIETALGLAADAGQLKTLQLLLTRFPANYGIGSHGNMFSPLELACQAKESTHHEYLNEKPDFLGCVESLIGVHTKLPAALKKKLSKGR